MRVGCTIALRMSWATIWRSSVLKALPTSSTRRPASWVTLGLLVGLLALIIVAVGATANGANTARDAAARNLVTFPGAYGRILEFITVNPGVPVVGLREGSTLRVEGTTLELLGEKTARVFVSGREPSEYEPGLSLQFLMP